MDDNERFIWTGALLFAAAIASVVLKVDVLSYLLMFLSGAAFPTNSVKEAIKNAVN